MDCDFCGDSVGVKTYKLNPKDLVLCAECFQNVVMDAVDNMVSDGILNENDFKLYLGEVILSAHRDGIQFKHMGSEPLTEDLRIGG